MTQCLGKVTMIVFMIAQHIDHMWETSTATFKEVMESVATIVLTHDPMRIMLNQVCSHHDVAAEDQDISTVAVVKIQVSKLKM